MINDEMIQYLKTVQEKNVIERRERLAKIIYKYPCIDICSGRIPTQEEIYAIQRCPLYDGMLIIYDPIKGYENGIIKDLPVEELVAIAKTFYNMMVYTTDHPLPSNNCLKRFRQINYMQGGLVIFHKSSDEIPY